MSDSNYSYPTGSFVPPLSSTGVLTIEDVVKEEVFRLQETSPEFMIDPVIIREPTEYEAIEAESDFSLQEPPESFSLHSNCKDYMLTEFGNYDDDGTFFPGHLNQHMNRYPSIDDNLRAKSGNFWTYIGDEVVLIAGVQVNKFNYFRNEFPEYVPLQLSYTEPTIIEGADGKFFTTIEKVKIKTKGGVFNPYTIPTNTISDRVISDRAEQLHRQELFKTFIEGGTNSEGDVYPPLVEGAKVFTDHTSFISALYKEKEVENLDLPSICFAKIEDHYNSYIQPYEDLLSNPAVHENTLPNVYAFHLQYEDGANPWFKKLITLEGWRNLEKAVGEGILSNAEGACTEDCPVGEYFIEYANSYFDDRAATPNMGYPNLNNKYKRIIVPYEDRLGNALYEKYAGLFPMSINIEFKTDQRTKFAEILSSANLSTQFAEYMVQVISEYDSEEGEYLESWEYGNSRSGRSSNKIIDLSRYINDMLEGEYNVDYDEALYLGMSEDQELELDDFSIISMIFSAVLYGKTAELMKDKYRTFASLMQGKSAYSETVMYKICKFKNGEKIQEIYLPNSNSVDVHKYIDTQVKYGQVYEYKIYGYELVIGNEYGYYDMVTNELDEAIVTVLNKPVLKMIEAELFTRTVAVVDHPPVAPDIHMVPFKGVNNTIRCMINNNIGKVKTQPIYLNQGEKQRYDDYRLLKDMEEGEPILFQSDDIPEQFEIFRIEEYPEKYEDFSSNRLAILRTNISPELKKSSIAFDDRIRPNQKYYYMFRSVDIHGNLSLPSEVYEGEMIDNDGAVYPVINPVVMGQKNMNAPSMSAKRFVKIKPSTVNLFFKDEELGGLETAPTEGVQLGLSDKPAWDRRFKIRLTSKQTGKKVDINFKFVDKPQT
jgi:hypothetical protein